MSGFGPKLLLVEGSSDRFFVESYNQLQITPCFEIRVCGGVSNLTEKARVYAWLATRRKPGLIGKAVAEELELDGEVVGRFLAWLRELFR